ncbi:polysaccharide biosynthesis protein [Brevibacterium yomogidense]|uniref:polysaccharide biosynthesis protein n=1 Tax=Brevibacterium yomogidense TaxID=946573 RepID=UPI0018DF3B36|nr:polysaccharide biosynthesis protein [Brevibacterium yomogidense]
MEGVPVTEDNESATRGAAAPHRTDRRSSGVLLGALLRSFGIGLAFAVCLWIAALVRYDFSLSEPNFTGIAVCSLLGLIVCVGMGPLVVYRDQFWRVSGDEFIAIGGVFAVVSGLIYAANAVIAPLVPLSVPLTASALAIVVIGMAAWLRGRMRALRRTQRGRSKRALILGAGAHGLTAFRLITDDPQAEHVAVGFLDDDPEKNFLRVQGIRVLGRLADLGRVLEERPVDVVLIAIRELSPAVLDTVIDVTQEAGVEIKVLPELDVYDLRERGAYGGSTIATRPASFRPIEIDDLIGRRPISTDVDAIAGYLRGKTILVTGAGGSIGSHLCKQLVRFSPGRVVMTDRDESGLHSTQLVLEGSAMLTSENLVLGDLRDAGFVRSLVASVQPDIIFHAAALKHLTFLERFPDEAIMTNVGASMSLLDAAVENRVPQFVHISTDKAADPTSVLGASKYTTERAVAAVAADTGFAYMSVRFGNVLGSRGSVLGTFVSQAQAGGPLTITAPGVKRFFMSADEACELVLQAGAIGNPGETLVLDMGEPVAIEDLARRVITLSGRDDITIRYTGLREGEKLEETRLAVGEQDQRPKHHLISQVAVPPASLAQVRGLIASARISGHRRNDELTSTLRKAVQTAPPGLGRNALTRRSGDAPARPSSAPATAPLTLTSILGDFHPEGQE